MPVAAHDLGKLIERQRVGEAALLTGCCFGGGQRVEDRLFCCLGRGLEQRRDQIGRQHVHTRDRLTVMDVVTRGEGQENVAD